MKYLVFITLTLISLNTAALAAGPDSYQCVRPDGRVVCTVNAPSGDPSVVCNHDCVDCNMTCAARQIVVREGNELMFNPGASPPVQSGPAGASEAETKQYCQHQYLQCVSRCRSNPNNMTQQDVDACTSSCDSSLSGCGRKP